MSREERHYFDPLAGRVLPEGIEEINETSVHRWKTFDARLPKKMCFAETLYL